MSDPVLDAVTAAARAPGVYGVACSGGADSMALADAAIRVLGAARVVVATIDHGLVDSSATVANAVALWARGQGATAVVRRVIVERRASLEAAARDARYAELEALVAELGLAAMLVGHTARDQAETVLLRIVRGTGPAGLAAMAPVRWPIVRPLLALPRAAIETYAAARSLPVHPDPMNEDARFARVRVRTELMPALRRGNPSIDAALVRLADASAEWLAAIDAYATPHARFPIDCAALAKHPAAVRKRALALALEARGLGYAATHLEALDALVIAPRAGERGLDLPGARITRTYDTLEADREVRLTDPPVADEGHVLRTYQPGDRIRLDRLGGRSRKLSDLYTDLKVPASERRNARVLVRVKDGAITWAEHVGIAFDDEEIT